MSAVFPLYLAEKYSRTNFFVAQAFTNVPEKIYGILVRLDTSVEGLAWYQVILHEMSHIFCIVEELDGENFQDKYSQERIGANNQYWCASIGYTIWREFIADHIAALINPFMRSVSLADLRKLSRELGNRVKADDPDRAIYCSELLFYLFSNPKIKNAKDAPEIFQILERNRIFSTKKQRVAYLDIMALIHRQLQRENFWEIDFGFMKEIGVAYLSLILLAGRAPKLTNVQDRDP